MATLSCLQTTLARLEREEEEYQRRVCSRARLFNGAAEVRKRLCRAGGSVLGELDARMREWLAEWSEEAAVRSWEAVEEVRRRQETPPPPRSTPSSGPAGRWHAPLPLHVTVLSLFDPSNHIPTTLWVNGYSAMLCCRGIPVLEVRMLGPLPETLFESGSVGVTEKGDVAVEVEDLVFRVSVPEVCLSRPPLCEEQTIVSGDAVLRVRVEADKGWWRAWRRSTCEAHFEERELHERRSMRAAELSTLAALERRAMQQNDADAYESPAPLVEPPCRPKLPPEYTVAGHALLPPCAHLSSCTAAVPGRQSPSLLLLSRSSFSQFTLPAADAPHQLPPPPFRLTGASLVCHKEFCYVYGGYGAEVVGNIFSLTSTTAPPAPGKQENRKAPGKVKAPVKKLRHKTIEAAARVYCRTGEGRRKKPPPPQQKQQQRPAGVSGSVFEYSWGRRVWTEVPTTIAGEGAADAPPLVVHRAGHTAGVCGHYMVVFGGWGLTASAPTPSRTCCAAVLSLKTGIWRRVAVSPAEGEPALPAPRSSHAGTVWGQSFFVHGGFGPAAPDTQESDTDSEADCDITGWQLHRLQFQADTALCGVLSDFWVLQLERSNCPRSGTWRRLRPRTSCRPPGMVHHALSPHGDCLYLAGGPHAALYQWSHPTESWRRVSLGCRVVKSFSPGARVALAVHGPTPHPTAVVVSCAAPPPDSQPWEELPCELEPGQSISLRLAPCSLSNPDEAEAFEALYPLTTWSEHPDNAQLLSGPQHSSPLHACGGAPCAIKQQRKQRLSQETSVAGSLQSRSPTKSTWLLP